MHCLGLSSTDDVFEGAFVPGITPAALCSSSFSGEACGQARLIQREDREISNYPRVETLFLELTFKIELPDSRTRSALLRRVFHSNMGQGVAAVCCWGLGTTGSVRRMLRGCCKLLM